MRKFYTGAGALLVAILLAGCSWSGTGVVTMKPYFKEDRHLMGKSYHTHPECWGLSILDNEYKKKLRNKYQSSEKYEMNLKSKYTHTVCVSKEVWDATAEGTIMTIEEDK